MLSKVKGLRIRWAFRCQGLGDKHMPLGHLAFTFESRLDGFRFDAFASSFTVASELSVYFLLMSSAAHMLYVICVYIYIHVQVYNARLVNYKPSTADTSSYCLFQGSIPPSPSSRKA